MASGSARHVREPVLVTLTAHLPTLIARFTLVSTRARPLGGAPCAHVRGCRVVSGDTGVSDESSGIFFWINMVIGWKYRKGKFCFVEDLSIKALRILKFVASEGWCSDLFWGEAVTATNLVLLRALHVSSNSSDVQIICGLFSVNPDIRLRSWF